MDYEMKTTFMSDFSIANRFGERAVRDTYNRAFKEWHTNVEYITEFTMVLNWQLWMTYEQGNQELAKVYDELWREMSDWCINHLKGDDLKYYLRTSD